MAQGSPHGANVRMPESPRQTGHTAAISSAAGLQLVDPFTNVAESCLSVGVCKYQVW